ncbi:MAG TPA: methionyl-tRNA formyltransferase [Bryobacteraceae bacterium]|nr:methionyl-tRNA formyltransferase [Bryobacteraceae bacterium]HPT26735.1 methionyl-tRNA formyltransferase [Bryobacteraceae bacterium]
MKLVFLGTPEFAVPSLEALVEAGHAVAAVYTQPDRPKGRGQQLAFPPVKDCALRLGLEVRQPLKIRHCLEELATLESDAMVVVGYGQIIPQSIIDLPHYGIFNVHASLLPLYRGAAPMQWAVANGETVTGVSIMQIEAGLDTGPVLKAVETCIGPEETSIGIAPRLAAMGARLMVSVLEEVLAGRAVAVPQDHTRATLAPILRKEDGLIDWHRSAGEIHNRSRGFLPWPGAYTRFRGERLSIWRCRVAEGAASRAPGSLTAVQRRLFVSCGGGTAIELIEVQQEGRKRMTAEAFINGARIADGDLLGE